MSDSFLLLITGLKTHATRSYEVRVRRTCSISDPTAAVHVIYGPGRSSVVVRQTADALEGLHIYFRFMLKD